MVPCCDGARGTVMARIVTGCFRCVFLLRVFVACVCCVCLLLVCVCECFVFVLHVFVAGSFSRIAGCTCCHCCNLVHTLVIVQITTGYVRY